MKHTKGFIIGLQALLGVKSVFAADVTITSWDALRSHANDLNQSYLLEGNFEPRGGSIDVGSSGNAGTWTLNGNNILIDGNYGNNGFSGNFATLNNVDFLFQNMNTQFVKKNNGQGGFLYNTASGRLIDSNFKRTGAQNGGVLYNAEAGRISLIDNVKFDDNFVDNGKGGAIANVGEIKSIANSVFNANNAYSNSIGGAIYNDGTIEKIGDSTTFVGNKATNGAGAIYNDANGKIASISAEFTENHSGYNGGGAIINNGNIVSVNNSLFEGNSADTSNRNSDYLDAKGGAVYNKSNASKIEGISNTQFYSNYSEDFGGAISNFGVINKIDNVAFGTEDKGNKGSSGGAIDNENGGVIENILNSSFESNIALENSDFVQGNGGAIRNYNNAKIGLVQGTNFIGNAAGGLKDEYKGEKGNVSGGAIYNAALSTIEKIENTKFTDNKALAGHSENYAGTAKGGAIYNDESSTIKSINNTVFEGNYANGTVSSGGAVYNTKLSDTATSAEPMIFTNVQFKNNYAQSETALALGGAIYSERDVSIRAEGEGKESVFSGNYTLGADGKKDEAVYMKEALLELSAADKGKVIFDDDIRGAQYTVNVTGDGNSEVFLKGNVSGAQNFNLAENGVLHLGKSAKIETERYSANNGVLKLDVAVDAENKSVENGLLQVGEDVLGRTNVIVNAETPDTFEGAETVFVSAPNDDRETSAEFNVSRVIGSPYMWNSVAVQTGEDKGTDWKLSLSTVKNPDYENGDNGDDNNNGGDDNNGGGNGNKPEKPVYAPEVAGYVGVQSVVIEQNRSIADSVARGIAAEKSIDCYEESCGVAELVTRKKAWLDLTNESSDLKSPVDMDADIQGMTAGLDLYSDGMHRAGVFGSYRHGKYDLSGKGDYYSFLGSDIKADSYLGGMYYQYKQDDWKFLGLAFAGKQDLDIKTDDRIAFASTNGMQYGVSAEAAKKIAVRDYLNIEPSLGVRYTMSDIDSLKDNVGKTADFDVVHYLEAELGLKVERIFCDDGLTNRLYVKPSIIQAFAEGGKTKISGIQHKIKTMDNQTLGRLEAGGEFGLNEKLSGYIRGGYTTGDDYSAYDINLGINYAF